MLKISVLPKMNMLHLFFVIFFLMAIFTFYNISSASAATCTFASAGTNDWNTAANWDCGHIPYGTDDVIIPASTSTVLSADASSTQLTVNTGSTINADTFILRTNGLTTIDFGATVTSTSGALNFYGYTTSSGSIGTVTGSISFVASSTNNGLIDSGNSSGININNITTNNGTILHRQGTNLYIGNTATLINNGTIISNDLMQIMGSWTNNGTFTAQSNNRVGFMGGMADQYIPSITCTVLYINKSVGSAIMTGHVTTTSDVQLASDPLTMSGFYLTVGSHWSNTGGILNGTSTVIFNGAGTQNVSIEPDFPSITINKSGGTINFNGSVTSTGDVRLKNGTMNLGNYVLHLSGDWITTGGTLSPTASGIEFFGSNPSIISGQPQINSLIINKTAATTTLTSDLLITNAVWLTNGILDLNGNTASVAYGWTVTNGTSANNGTVKFYGNGSQSISGNSTFYNLVIYSSSSADLQGIVTTTHDVTLSSGELRLNGHILNVGHDWIKTGGTLVPGGGGVKFYGPSASTIDTEANFGHLIIDKDALIDANFNGNVTTTNFTILNGDAMIGGLIITMTTSGAPFVHTGGSFEVSTTLKYTGSATTSISASPNNLILAGTGRYTIGGSSTINGNLTLNSGIFDIGSWTFGLKGNWLQTGGTVDGTGSIEFTDTNIQTITSSVNLPNTVINKTGGYAINSGNIGFASELDIQTGTFQQATSTSVTVYGTTTNNGTLNVGYGASFTSYGDLINSGTFSQTNGSIVLRSDWDNTGGTYVPGGTVNLSGSNNQSLPGNLSFANLMTNKSAGTVTMQGNTTSTGFFVTNGTFDIGNYILNVPGTFSNSGLVIVGASGRIKHPLTSQNFTNSSWVTQTEYTSPGQIYLQIQDANRNLNGAVAETITVSVTTNAAAGSDSETITLTETGPATGIFRSSGNGLFNASTANPGNNEIDLVASGIGTETYTDPNDSTDTGFTTVTLTKGTVTNNNNSGGGGGGSGYLPPPVTTQQTSTNDPNKETNLANLTKLNIAVHSLVKLPDDQNPETQIDSAVYYIGADGKRHAFPNSNVFFTWYSNFDDVKIISLDDIASIPLGANVRYKPGIKMVKFLTDPKVYAVDSQGFLRWVVTEQMAINLYGADWNTRIDDISDSFYNNYSFGDDIWQNNQFNPQTIVSLDEYISNNLGL